MSDAADKSILIAVRDGNTGRMLHDNIHLRAFIASWAPDHAPEEEIDRVAASFEQRLLTHRGIEIHRPSGEIYALFIKGLKCKCCGHTN
jgi:hypothetical protein